MYIRISTLYGLMCMLAVNPLRYINQLLCNNSLCKHVCNAMATFNVLSRQNWSGRTDFGRKTCQNRSPRTTFAAKIGPAEIGPAGPILAAKNGPLLPKSVLHGGLILAKIICQNWSPLKVALLFLHIYMATWMHLLYLAMHGYLASLHLII